MGSVLWWEFLNFLRCVPPIPDWESPSEQLQARASSPSLCGSWRWIPPFLAPGLGLCKHRFTVPVHQPSTSLPVAGEGDLRWRGETQTQGRENHQQTSSPGCLCTGENLVCPFTSPCAGISTSHEGLDITTVTAALPEQREPQQLRERGAEELNWDQQWSETETKLMQSLVSSRACLGQGVKAKMGPSTFPKLPGQDVCALLPFFSSIKSLCGISKASGCG